MSERERPHVIGFVVAIVFFVAFVVSGADPGPSWVDVPDIIRGEPRR